MPIIGASATTTEVFGPDHRWQHGFCRITNGLLRYSVDMHTPGHPLIEVWSGSAWVTVGNYQLQALTASAYVPLPVQGISFLAPGCTITPEEVAWEERRYDANGTSLVRVVNRIRRGSRLIESQIIVASGMGLNGNSSVGITNSTATAIATAADGSGTLGTGGTALPGFVYISGKGLAAGISGGVFQSGVNPGAGTIAVVHVLAGYQDAQYLTPSAVPTGLSAVVTNAGSTSDTYAMTSIDGYGVESAQSAQLVVPTANATLNGTNYNTISSAASLGAKQYNLYRIANGQGLANGLIANGTSPQLVDTGQAVIANPATGTKPVGYIGRWAAYGRTRIRQRLMV